VEGSMGKFLQHPLVHAPLLFPGNLNALYHFGG
jgi:hypothetical protein